MFESESRLALIIDSTGAQKNSESLVSVLDKMTQAGLEAEKSVDGGFCHVTACRKVRQDAYRPDASTERRA